MQTFKVYLKSGDIITDQAKNPDQLRIKYGVGNVAKIKKVKQ